MGEKQYFSGHYDDIGDRFEVETLGTKIFVSDLDDEGNLRADGVANLLFTANGARELAHALTLAADSADEYKENAHDCV